MKPIQVWMPECWMENHREQEHTDALRAALKAERVYVVDLQQVDHPVEDVDLAFFGSWKYYPRSADFRTMFPTKPVVHYNWDIYPFQVRERTDPRTDRTGRARPTPNATRWAEYISELRYSTEVWVPSQGVVRRTHEFAGPTIDCQVVRCNYFGWDKPGADWWQVMNVDLSKPYVMDVMRQYPEEPMVGSVRRACGHLGIPCIQSDHRLTWDEFRCAVVNASLLVSSYNEASTGGLTLLEGYAHGVPVLVSDSPLQGANDYFGDRAFRFQAGNEEDLESSIKFYAQVKPAPEDVRRKAAGEAARWVEENYGVRAFARRLAAGFRRVLRGPGQG
jgi:glycosyltransferase involved in cell wall biosynthesis